MSKAIRGRVILGWVLTLGSLGGALAPLTATAADIISDVAPPAPRAERAPPHRDGFVWAPGHWEWSGRSYAWVGGTWIAERRGAHWIADSWAQSGDHWQYAPGHWER